jgi:hypothetical protein
VPIATAVGLHKVVHIDANHFVPQPVPSFDEHVATVSAVHERSHPTKPVTRAVKDLAAE